MQDSLYVRARRGELPDVLPHDEIALLASAHIKAPWGELEYHDDGPWERLRHALEALIQCGEVTPLHDDDGPLTYCYVFCRFEASPAYEPCTTKGTRYYLARASVLSVLPELGDVADGLKLWLGVLPHSSKSGAKIGNAAPKISAASTVVRNFVAVAEEQGVNFKDEVFSKESLIKAIKNEFSYEGADSGLGKALTAYWKERGYKDFLGGRPQGDKWQQEDRAKKEEHRLSKAVRIAAMRVEVGDCHKLAPIIAARGSK